MESSPLPRGAWALCRPIGPFVRVLPGRVGSFPFLRGGFVEQILSTVSRFITAWLWCIFSFLFVYFICLFYFFYTVYLFFDSTLFILIMKTN